MKVFAILLACACAFSGAAHAALIATVDLDLPGGSTGTVGPVGATPSPNNDNSTGPSPNVVPYVIFLNSPGAFESVFTVTNSAGTTEYAFAQTLVNNSGAAWTGFRFEIGFRRGPAFRVSSLPDDLDFDAPTFDPFPVASALSAVATQPDVLQWSGGTVIPVGTSTFSFSIDVPDGLSQWHPDGLNAFTLRQVPVTATVVPEPATLVLLLVAGVVACVGQVRARKSCDPR